MIALWRRLLVIVKAVLTGTLAATIGTVPWALLVAANQTPSKPAPLIWETGPGASFMITAIGAVLVSAAAIWAYRALAVVARNASA